jgi:peptidyl-prolyl cis-trans isomerase C
MKFPIRGAYAAPMLALALMFTSASAFAQNAAVVNGKAIPKAKVDEFVQMLAGQGRPDTPELRAAVRDELIARELFVQEAEKRGLLKSPEVQRQLDMARQDILIRALLAETGKANPIKDEEVKAEYDRVVKAQAGKEYKARHILVEKEETAKQIIEQLKKGAKFEELAKQSTDKGSAEHGGDLDWNAPGTFVPEFSDAMVKLEKGKFTQAPVKSQFGYHVIRVDDIRDAKAPPLDQVRPQIMQKLERERIDAVQKSLRAKAKIQ